MIRLYKNRYPMPTTSTIYNIQKIILTGSSGFLGQHVLKELDHHCSTVETIHTVRSSEYDLRDVKAIDALLDDKPADTIIHLAAKVGGIGANQKHPGQFFYDNLMMSVQLIEKARLKGIKKFVAIGTICSYPKFAPIPFKEEDLWIGYPEETNAPYGLAKKMLLVQLQAYRQEYGFNGITIMLTNLYGPHDSFDLESCHVIPAMIRKFHMAKQNGDGAVTLWGDGTPSREFLYVEDAARGIRLAAERYDSSEPVNLGSGVEVPMKKLAEMVKETVGYEGEVIWDTSRPNGQPRRSIDTTRAQSFGFVSNMLLPRGLELTYKSFLESQHNIGCSYSDHGDKLLPPSSLFNTIEEIRQS